VGRPPLWVDLKLYQILVVGHVVSTTPRAAVSAARPEDFDFSEIAQEYAKTDGGETG
jgi:hypothetical protein